MCRHHLGVLDLHAQRLRAGKRLLIRVEVRGSGQLDGRITFFSQLSVFEDWCVKIYPRGYLIVTVTHIDSRQAVAH